MAGERRWDELPEDCWELVLNRLNQYHHRHFESVSLVCKKFLSISNRIRSRFSVTNPTIQVHGTISGFLRRFRELKRIDLVEYRGDLDIVIREIAHSGLSLEVLDLSNQRRIPVRSMKELGKKMCGSLRILICSRLRFLQDSDLIVIADYFPYLEELDISYPQNDFGSSERDLDSGRFPGIVSDDGVAVLSTNLRSLRRINISGNHFLSDRSLISLSLNCIFLSGIAALDCSFVGQDGIVSAIRNSSNLVSLSVNENRISYYSSSYPSIALKTSPFNGRILRDLDFYQMVISDEFLFSIGEANLPLKKLALRCCHGFTFIGIHSVLKVYQSLNYLDLEGAVFLNNQSIIDLSQYLHELSFICLNSCHNLSNSTFFTLAKNCPSLEEIRMERTSIGKYACITDNTKKNLCIQILGLAGNRHLSDTTLVHIGSVCPKLKYLDLSSCCSITQGGLNEFGRSCHEMVEFKVNGCREISTIGIGFTFCKLEALDAGGSKIDDEGLMMIGRSCPGLQHLDLEGCLRVTERGVKEVLKGCKGLREVNLRKCYGVREDVLAWMVFSRPSLRKIVPPRDFSPSEGQRDLFLRHGCMVCGTLV